MPFQLPDIEYPAEGLPRQPVALRLAPRILDWPVKDLIGGLVDPLIGPPVYQFHPEHPNGRVNLTTLRDLHIQMASLESDADLVEVIPADYYVWSDDIATAFTNFVDCGMGREAAAEAGLCLNWAPALGGLHTLLAECPDLSSLVSPNDQAAPTSENNFAYAGNQWVVTFSGKTRSLRKRKGYLAIAALLERPYELVPVAELNQLLNPNITPDAHIPNKMLLDRVVKNIKNAKDPLEREFPALYRHLHSSLVTGRNCCYHPQPPISWRIELPTGNTS